MIIMITIINFCLHAASNWECWNRAIKLNECATLTRVIGGSYRTGMYENNWGIKWGSKARSVPVVRLLGACESLGFTASEAPLNVDTIKDSWLGQCSSSSKGLLVNASRYLRWMAPEVGVNNCKSRGLLLSHFSWCHFCSLLMNILL